jgi:hypothetical protein
MLNGENMVIQFSKLSRNKHIQKMVTLAFKMSISRLSNKSMICQGNKKWAVYSYICC